MNKRILVIGTVWPEPKSSAAGSRMTQLIHLFKELGFTEIHFATATTKTTNTVDLSELGVVEHIIELNNSSFDEFVKKLNPTIVVFDRFMTEEQYGWRVAENCPEAIKILDTEDLHFLRKARQNALKKSYSLGPVNFINDTTKREIASIYRCDLSLIISEFEMLLLKKEFKIDDALLCYLPFLFDDISEKLETVPTFNNRINFVTIGNFLHEPNVDGVKFLKQEIWTAIKEKLPKAEMHVYGAYPSEKNFQMHDEMSGFYIKGFAEDVKDVMQNARVCLVPLRFGAGLKGKLFDAMLNGTPCVTTSIGAEGVYANLNPNGFVEDDVIEFVNKAIVLYTDERVWVESQRHGYEVIIKRFNKNPFVSNFSQQIANLLTHRDVNRKNNFIGQMLMHHSLQSTKFMSKWIEEKNKKKAT